jgi:hypothetical protein
MPYSAAMAKKKNKSKRSDRTTEARPEFLYKYRSLSPPETRGFTLDIIRNNEIHFASSSSFNDPFESKFALRVGATPQQRLTYWTNGFRNAGQSQQNAEALAQQYNTRFEQYPDDFHEAEFGKILEEEIPQQAALLSLSTRPDDLLMWAHYASSHTGICLKFAVSVEQPFFRVAQEVEYSGDYPEFNYFTSTGDEKLEKSLLTKSKHWKYEAEYRIIDPGKAPGLRPFHPDLLAGVILGAKISDPDRDDVIALLGDRAPICVAELDRSRFRINIVAT